MDGYMAGVIIGIVISGSIIGAIPAICGAIRGKIGLAIGGFFACLAASAILGMILGIPVCAVFMFLIFRKTKSDTSEDQQTETTKHTAKKANAVAEREKANEEKEKKALEAGGNVYYIDTQMLGDEYTAKAYLEETLQIALPDFGSYDCHSDNSARDHTHELYKCFSELPDHSHFVFFNTHIFEKYAAAYVFWSNFFNLMIKLPFNVNGKHFTSAIELSADDPRLNFPSILNVYLSAFGAVVDEDSAL